MNFRISWFAHPQTHNGTLRFSSSLSRTETGGTLRPILLPSHPNWASPPSTEQVCLPATLSGDQVVCTTVLYCLTIPNQRCFGGSPTIVCSPWPSIALCLDPQRPDVHREAKTSRDCCRRERHGVGHAAATAPEGRPAESSQGHQTGSARQVADGLDAQLSPCLQHDFHQH